MNLLFPVLIAGSVWCNCPTIVNDDGLWNYSAGFSANSSVNENLNYLKQERTTFHIEANIEDRQQSNRTY